MNSVFALILVVLTSSASMAAQPNICDKPIKEAILADAKKKKIGNPTFIDGDVFSEMKPGVFHAMIGGDTAKGFFNIEYKIEVKKSDTCTVTKITETKRYAHEEN